MTRILSLFLALALFGAAGCDDDKKPNGGGGDAGEDATTGTDGGDGGSEPINASTQEAISVAEGGEIELEDATLTIPENAIQSDEATVEITMKAMTPPGELPDLGSVVTLFYEFEPEGLQFNPPAELKIPVPADLGDNVAVISYFNEGTDSWENLPTVNDGTFLITTISHFSGYAGRIVEGSSCAFEACGGDVSGVWDVDTFCEEADVNTENPFSGDCGGASFEVTEEQNGGYLSFYGEGQQLSYSLSITGTRTVSGSVPVSCLQALEAEECATLGETVSKAFELESATCTENGNACACTGTGASDGFEAAGEYATAEDTVILQISKQESVVFDVCVREDGEKLDLGSGERVIKFTKNNMPK